MILVDTSVWVDHFRRRDSSLQHLIANGAVALHPFVLGELALGGVPQRSAMALDQLSLLPSPPVASTPEAMAFIAWAKLANTGIGYVDAHLLLSARMTSQGTLFTRDQRLHTQAERLQIAYAQ